MCKSRGTYTKLYYTSMTSAFLMRVAMDHVPVSLRLLPINPASPEISTYTHVSLIISLRNVVAVFGSTIIYAPHKTIIIHNALRVILGLLR